jgi:hypothetical protein
MTDLRPFPEKNMRCLLILLALLMGSLAPMPLVSTAQACPMCKFANEDGSQEGQTNTVADLRPKAYMYSILFMISMPATILAGFGFSFYRLWKKEQELSQISLDGPLDG